MLLYSNIAPRSLLPETAEVNIQVDSHAGGDIYRPMHPLRTFVAFTIGGKNSSNSKRRQLKLGTSLAELTPSKYLGPHNLSAWSKYL